MRTSKLLMVVCVMVFAGVVMASHAMAYNFTDPTKVNLLERWNTNGTYALTTSVVNMAGDPTRAEMYHTEGYALRAMSGQNGVNRSVRYTFDSPKTIGKIEVLFRGSESPQLYTVADQNGVFFTRDVSPSYVGGTDYIDSITPRTSNYIEVAMNPYNSSNSYGMIQKVGAYLATGETLTMDGTYNVFYQEQPAPVGVDSSLLTDFAADRFNPGNANYTAWHFSKPYKFTGAFMTHENDAWPLYGATIQVSSDSTNGVDGTWTTAYNPTDFISGYMVFSQQAVGTWAKLSWADSGSGGGREINEFQLFATQQPVPEPATLALVAFGALGLIIRRK